MGVKTDLNDLTYTVPLQRLYNLFVHQKAKIDWLIYHSAGKAMCDLFLVSQFFFLCVFLFVLHTGYLSHLKLEI